MGTASSREVDQAYYTAMAANDEFGVVIRSGAYIDHELIKLIEMTVPNPRALKNVPLDYAGRCALAVALGLDERFQAPLSALGKIRNKLAHRPEAALTSEDTNNLYKALSAEERKVMHERFAQITKDRGEKGRFNDLAPFDRFVLMSVILRSALVAARRGIERDRSSAGQ